MAAPSFTFTFKFKFKLPAPGIWRLRALGPPVPGANVGDPAPPPGAAWPAAAADGRGLSLGPPPVPTLDGRGVEPRRLGVGERGPGLGWRVEGDGGCGWDSAGALVRVGLRRVLLS